MSRGRAFFVSEAEECLREAGTAMTARDAAAAHGAIRRLRGSAQMARLGDLAEEALALEARLRSAATGSADLEPSLIESLERLASRVEEVRMEPVDRDPMEEERMDERTDGSGPAPAGDGRGAGAPVPLEALEYSGSPALDRAIDLRRPLENALVADEPVGPILDELFDLIRLGRK